MNYLRRAAKRALPSSVLYVLRDLKYIDAPRYAKGRLQQSKATPILRSHFYPKRTIYFLPERPIPWTDASRGSIAYKLCRLLGYGITTHALHRYERTTPRPYDAVFKYERTTFSTALSGDRFDVEHVINGGTIDVSKQAVNDAFEDVFDYALGVDPTTYHGAIVVKSNLNATHDGHVVEGPIAPAEVRNDCAYQKVIDNTVPGRDRVLDYRVPVHGDQIPLVYLKYRATESRFLNASTHAAIKAPAEVFSDDEMDKIHQFVRRLGMDYGELDVLRDKNGRIYVVDANPTPWGPPRGLTASDRERTLARLAQSFDALVCKYAMR